jgi:hypothetical protein
LSQKTLSPLASKKELKRSEIKLAERNNKQETGEQSGEKRWNGSAEFITKSQASQIGIPSLNLPELLIKYRTATKKRRFRGCRFIDS